MEKKNYSEIFKFLILYEKQIIDNSQHLLNKYIWNNM